MWLSHSHPIPCPQLTTPKIPPKSTTTSSQDYWFAHYKPLTHMVIWGTVVPYNSFRNLCYKISFLYSLSWWELSKMWVQCCFLKPASQGYKVQESFVQKRNCSGLSQNGFCPFNLQFNRRLPNDIGDFFQRRSLQSFYLFLMGKHSFEVKSNWSKVGFDWGSEINVK